MTNVFVFNIQKKEEEMRTPQNQFFFFNSKKGEEKHAPAPG
jgi:hypothetical protein